MTIKIERCADAIDQPLTIEEFAAHHRLTIVVREREHIRPGDSSRFYASFERCEIPTGGCLESGFGNGATPEEAIAAYADYIRGKKMVFDAYGDSRREFYAHVQ